MKSLSVNLKLFS